MYVAEGELLIAPNPQIYLGQFGVSYTAAETVEAPEARADSLSTREVRIVGASEHIASLLARTARGSGSLPQDAVVEHITTLNQAVKYATPTLHPVNIARRTMPRLSAALDDETPEGLRLLGGSIQVWKEFRFPTPNVYIAGLGKLIAHIQYSPEQGWQSKFDAVEGTRQVLGIVTPWGHAATTNSRVMGYGRVRA